MVSAKTGIRTRHLDGLAKGVDSCIWGGSVGLVGPTLRVVSGSGICTNKAWMPKGTQRFLASSVAPLPSRVAQWWSVQTGVRWPGCRSWLCHLALAVQARHLVIMCFSFLKWNMGMVIIDFGERERERQREGGRGRGVLNELSKEFRIGSA